MTCPASARVSLPLRSLYDRRRAGVNENRTSACCTSPVSRRQSEERRARRHGTDGGLARMLRRLLACALVVVLGTLRPALRGELVVAASASTDWPTFAGSSRRL